MPLSKTIRSDKSNKISDPSRIPGSFRLPRTLGLSDQLNAFHHVWAIRRVQVFSGSPTDCPGPGYGPNLGVFSRQGHFLARAYLACAMQSSGTIAPRLERLSPGSSRWRNRWAARWPRRTPGGVSGLPQFAPLPSQGGAPNRSPGQKKSSGPRNGARACEFARRAGQRGNHRIWPVGEGAGRNARKKSPRRWGRDLRRLCLGARSPAHIV